MLTGWQGKCGPCVLFEWVQGQRSPVRQLVDDDVAATLAVRDQAVLPPDFELYTTCQACSTWIEALGSCERDVCGRRPFTPLDRGGRLSYFEQSAGRGTTASVSPAVRVRHFRDCAREARRAANPEDDLVETTSDVGTTHSLAEHIDMPWFILFVAGLLEIGWAVGLKYTDGFTKLWPTVGTAVSLLASMGLLGLSLRTLPLGTAYAVWTGIGTVGTAILGIVLFREPATFVRIICITMIVAGIIGLKLASGAHHANS
jgi:quaternary ammonium compound-resistance protein SugE